MSDIHQYRLINRKTDGSRTGPRFVIISGLDIRASLHAGRDGRKRIATVDINAGPGLETGGGHHICSPTGNRQV